MDYILWHWLWKLYHQNIHIYPCTDIILNLLLKALIVKAHIGLYVYKAMAPLIVTCWSRGMTMKNIWNMT